MEDKETLRKAMGLSSLDPDNDKVFKQGKDFPKRKELQESVLNSSIGEKPDGPELWATEKAPSAEKNSPKCHMQVTVVSITAVVEGGNEDNSDITPPKEEFIPRELAGEWSIENLLCSNSYPEKPHKGVNMAAPVSFYSFEDYWMYVPQNIRNNVTNFKQQYVARHGPSYAAGVLKEEHVTVCFFSFKCNIIFGDEDDIKEHFENVHGVTGGPAKLTRVQQIKVNQQLPFEIKKLGEIENFSNAKKLEIVRGLYVNCQSRGVVSDTNNKTEAFLFEERSKEFMQELAKACSPLFFSRVEESIREKVKKDVSESFTAKWTVIETAILSAVGREHNITKIDNFIDKDGTDFYGFPLDILFKKISHYVDEVFEPDTSTFNDSKFRTLSEYSFTIRWKYILIIKLVRSLPASFSNVKEHIRQEAADILCDIEQTKDIGDFIKELKTFFKTNGHLKQFTIDNVPAPTKKNLSANKTGIEDKSKNDNPEKQKKYSENYEKSKVEPHVEKKFRHDIIANLSKLCTDANSTTMLGSLQEFRDFCKKNQNSACFCCLSINCLKRQKAAQEAKMKKIHNKKCSKKQLTLGEVKAMLNKKEVPKPDEGTSVNATASFRTFEGDNDNVSSLVYECIYNDEEETDSTFSACMADVKIEKEITMEMLQTRFQYWSSNDKKAMNEDKTCIICHKRNMNWPRYSDHLNDFHDIEQYENRAYYMEFNSVVTLRKEWIEEEKPVPDPRYYDSVNDQELSGFESESDASSDEENPIKLIKLPAKTESENSSSESEDEQIDQTFQPKHKKSSSTDSSSDSEDYQNSQSKPKRSRQQIRKKLKNVAEQMNITNENIGNFEGRLVGIEDNVTNISTEIDSMKKMQKSGISALNNTMENGSKLVEENIKNLHSELKSVSDSSAELAAKLEESHRNYNDLVIRNSKLQMMQKECNDELKKVQKETSSEISSLKKDISELMIFLKNDRNELSGQQESSINNKDGIVSTDDLSVPPEVMTSNSSSIITIDSNSVVKRTSEETQQDDSSQFKSDIPSSTNLINNCLDFSATQAEAMDQSQLSDKEPKKETLEVIKGKKSGDNSPAKVTNSTSGPLHHTESISKMFIRRSFDAFENVTKMCFNTIKEVTNLFNTQPGFLFMVLAILMLNVGVSKAATIPGQDNFLATNAFSRIQGEQEMILFDVTSFDTKDFLFNLGEVNQRIHSGLNSSCAAINAMNKQCSLHPENCNAADLAIINLESSIEKYLQTEYALQRICDAGDVPSSSEIIRRCHAGENWENQYRGKRYIPSRSVPSSTITEEEDYTHSKENLDSESILERVQRFVISGAILIATAFGVAGLATAAGTAAVIAKNQAQKVLRRVQANRAEDIKNSVTNDKFILSLIQDQGADLDGLRETTTLSTHAQTNLNQAIALEDKFSHLTSRSGIIEFSDPSQEVFMQAIKEMNNKDNEGLTRSEVGEKTRVSADITTVTTFVVPTKPSSAMCEERMILKTLFVPIIDHRSRRVVVMEGGKMFPKFGDRSRYILMSNNSFLSKQTKLFESHVRIVGRSCSIHISVNATVSPAPNPLFEDFHFRLNSNLTVTETCPSKDSKPSKKWIISSDTKLRLPLGCSLKSSLINCNSVLIQSEDSKTIHFSSHRMQIIEQHWNEDKVKFNESVFIHSTVEADPLMDDTTFSFMDSVESFKIPIIGSGGAAAALVIIVIITITAIRCQRGSNQAANPVIVQTTASTTPVISATATASPIITTSSSPVVTTTASPVVAAAAATEVKPPTAPTMCPPPAYEECQPTMDPEKIKNIDLSDRTPQQIAAMRRYSMRKPPHSNSA